MGQAQPGHADEARDVDCEDRRLVLLARLVERGAADREPRVVDEDVEAAETFDGRGDEPLAARGVGDVELECDLRLEALDAPRTPADASAAAVARPMPEEAPVTIARLPVRSRGAILP
jgi:hypothetical protein